MHKYLFVLLFISTFASSQQTERQHVPLSDEAKKVFSEAIFFSSLTNQVCETIRAENPLIENAIKEIKKQNYQISEYSVTLNSENSVIHKFYARTFEPSALIRVEIMSKQGQCDDFSFSLIMEEE